MTTADQPLVILLAVLSLIPVVVLISRRVARSNREKWQVLERTHRRRNIAEYRTWQWLFGRPKTRRLADMRVGPGRKGKP